MKRVKKQQNVVTKLLVPSEKKSECDNCRRHFFDVQLTSLTVFSCDADDDMSKNSRFCAACAICAFCCRPCVQYTFYQILDCNRGIACNQCATWCIKCESYVKTWNTVMINSEEAECVDHPKICSLCGNTCEYGALDLRDNVAMSTNAVACTNCAWACGCEKIHLQNHWEFGHCWVTATRTCFLCKLKLPDVGDEKEAIQEIRQRGLRWYHLKCFEKST